MADVFIPLVRKSGTGVQPTPVGDPGSVPPAVSARTILVDPVTRLEGHLKVQVERENDAVAAAYSSGMMFRGFENMLVGKDPRDAAHITQRICGVCPIAHGMAACLAMEAAAGASVTANARLIRNLTLGADFLHSHVLHFYHLALPSFIKAPDAAPWTPAYTRDIRTGATDNQRFVDHYIQALAIRRQAHELGALLGGKMPHAIAFEYGGVTTTPTQQDVAKAQELLAAVVAFVDGTYLPDADLLATLYPDYGGIGGGYGNLLAFGVFDLSADGAQKLLSRGLLPAGATQPQAIDLAAITESTAHSWYADSTPARNPADGVTEPDPDSASGYSWLKAPRHGGVPYEVGALARMRVSGRYSGSTVSVMDRHLARARETSVIAHAMQEWLAQIDPAASSFTRLAVANAGSGVGLTEAPRGALGHWLRLSGAAVASYQILTPTCWNCSPRDAAGAAGPLEQALVGTPAADSSQPVEVLRVIQSFDPCLSCAVH
ncbi:MAG: nickel-dependent hydrogenase large subunit [Anaerolineae bacterium]